MWRVNNHNNYQVSQEEADLLWTVKNVVEISNHRLKFNSSIDRQNLTAKVYKKNGQN